MNDIINNLINVLNKTGKAFCDFSLTMFVQASVLIILLLIIDILIRKRVRATFRYWIWMLVFIKLILPPALSLPTGIGNWFGEYFVVKSNDLDLQINNVTQEQTLPDEPDESAIYGNPIFSPQQIQQMQSYRRPVMSQAPIIPEISASSQAPEFPESITPVKPAVSKAIYLSWQGGVFLIWLVGVLVLSVLLIQRMFLVKSLIAQSEPAKNRLLETLEESSKQLGIRRNIQMKLSYNASSPAVCGLFKPVILIPTNLLGKISHEKFKAILIHELSHIRRKDLLINCAQTILQIVYFYNPLVWLANAIVRRIREQAVDEMVLVALGAEAKSYSNTLIDVAEMAFSQPTLSLRLVGVVESKKALSERIKHILSRPFPKSAKLGFLGLLVILISAFILLPMGKAQYSKQDIPYEDCQAVYEFDGIGDYLEIPDNKAFDIGKTFTAELWIKAEQASGEDSIFSKEIPWKSGWTLILFSGGEIDRIREIRTEENNIDQQDLYSLTFAVANGERFTNMTSKPIIKRNTWHHIAATIDNGKGTVFVDGHFVCSQELPYDTNASVPLRIGKGSMDLGRHFKGKLADLRIWNTARSLREIQQNMFRKLSGNEEGLVANWILKPDSNGQIKDISANKLNASINNDSLEQSESSIDSLDAMKGLIAYYPFDGDTMDRSGNNNNGLPQGTVDYASGVIGKAVRFYGIDDRGYIKVPNSDSLKFTDVVTVSLWVRIENGEGQTGMDGSGRKVPDAHHVFVAKSGDRVGFVVHSIHESREKRYIGIGAHYHTPRQSGAYYAPEAPLKKWMHISATTGVSGTKLYYNGELVETDDRPTDLSDSNLEDLYIGIQAGKGSILPWWFPLNGMIDELRIYNRELSAKEVKTLYNIGSSGISDELENTQFTATLPNGVTVELLGLNYIPVKDKMWWKPDGSLLQQVPYDSVDIDPSRDPNQNELTFYTIALQFHGRQPDDLGLIKWELSGAAPYAGSSNGYKNGKIVYNENLHAGYAIFPKDVEKTTLELGITEKEWKTVFSGRHLGFYENGKDSANVSFADRVGGLFGGVSSGEKGLHIDVVYNITDRAFRVIAVDKTGKIHYSADSAFGGTENLHETTASFPELSYDQLEEFRFQVRGYNWIKFEDISLRPDKEVIALSEQAKEQKNRELEPWLGEGQTRQIREQILILRECEIFKEMEKWTSAIRELVSIGKPAVPDLLEELQRTDRRATKSTIAFTLRAIADPDTVPILIEVLGKSKYTGSYGVSVRDDTLLQFMKINQYQPPSTGGSMFIIGCPVIEITTALEKITGHTEGHEHFLTKALNELGRDAEREAIEKRNQEIVKDVADHWQNWWQENKELFNEDDSLAEQVEIQNGLVTGITEITDENKDTEAANNYRNNFSATLTNGVTIELLGVCEHPSEGKQWWKPDGNALSRAPYLTTGNRTTDEKAGYKYYEFALKLTPTDASYFWMIPGSGHGSDTGSPRDENGRQIQEIKAYTTNLPEEQKSVNIRIGATAANWQTVVTYKPEELEETYSVGDYTIAFGIAYMQGNRTLLPVVHNYNRKERLYAIRVIAITKSGQTYSSGYSGSGGNQLNSLTYIFNGLSLENIKEIQFQLRPYEWVTFKNVYLETGAKTEMQIESENLTKPEELSNNGPFIVPLSNRVTSNSFVLYAGKEWEQFKNPAWSPDGKRIAFAGAKNDTMNIYTINLDGSGLKQITDMPQGRIAWGPTYRPNSNQIYYMDNSVQGPDFHWIAFTSQDGTSGRNTILMVPGGHSYTPASFASEGKQFCFTHSDRQQYHIKTAKADGSDIKTILTGPEEIGLAVWGKGSNNDRIAYSKVVEDSRSAVRSVFTIKTDGSEEKRLTDESLGDCYVYDWSPDGKWVIFSVDDKQIYAINSDGSNLIRITNDEYENNYSVFSPDGTKIAYISKRGEQFYIYIKEFSPDMQSGIENFPGRKEQKKRYFVTIVVGSDNDKIGYKDQQITWEELKDKLRNLPDKQRTVLEVAFEPGTIPVNQSQEEMNQWLAQNDSFRKAGKLVQELGLEYLSFVGQDHPSSRRGPVSIRVMQTLQLDKEIKVGLQSFEEKPLLEIRTIEFNKTQNGIVANLKLSAISYPHMFWEIGVRLLDDQGNQIDSVVNTYDNKGIIFGVPYIYEWEMKFDFGQTDISFADRFEVKLREIIKTETHEESGLIGYWSFDGNDNDSSTNRNNGVVHGATLTEGIEGQAYSFDGKDDYIEMNYDSSYNFGAKDFAVEAWIYPKAYKHQAIISRWELGKWAWDFRLGWDYGEKDKLYFFFSSDTEHGIKVSDTVSLNVWHHIAVTRRNGVLYGYLDGVEYNAGVQNGIAGNTNTNLVIGMFKGYGNGYFNGEIEDVEIYNRALTAEEVKKDFNKVQWGEEKEGLSCRLHPIKSIWSLGQTPEISLDLRNEREKTFSFIRVAEMHCEIEVDGQLYGWAEPIDIDAPIWSLGKGKELDDAINIKLTNSWALPLDKNKSVGPFHNKGKSLELTSGKHTIRVKFRPDGALGSPQTDLKDLSVISNPVEIEILSD